MIVDGSRSGRHSAQPGREARDPEFVGGWTRRSLSRDNTSAAAQTPDSDILANVVPDSATTCLLGTRRTAPICSYAFGRRRGLRNQDTCQMGVWLDVEDCDDRKGSAHPAKWGCG